MFGMFGAFNPQFYPKIARQAIGRSIGFILVFALIISALVSIKYTVVVMSGFAVAKQWVYGNFQKITSEYPVISVDKGEVKEPQQVFIKEYEKKFAIIVEPDPNNARVIMEKYPNSAVLTRGEFITKQTTDARGTSDIKTYSLDNKSFKIIPSPEGVKFEFEQRQFEVTPKFINKWIDIIALFVFPALLIIWFLVYSFTKPLQVFFFSLASLLITAILKVRFAYRELWNIGVYAVVPPTCLAALVDVTGLRLPLFGLLYCMIYLFYLYLGIKAVVGVGQQGGK
jgi:hypothetical protein